MTLAVWGSRRTIVSQAVAGAVGKTPLDNPPDKRQTSKFLRRFPQFFMEQRGQNAYYDDLVVLVEDVLKLNFG